MSCRKMRRNSLFGVWLLSGDGKIQNDIAHTDFVGPRTYVCVPLEVAETLQFPRHVDFNARTTFRSSRMCSDFHIGQRLSFASALCTVRYIGTVKGTKGEWLGVEWDDSARGKHSGEHDGVRYFTCT
jgi:hypothetical protein